MFTKLVLLFIIIVGASTGHPDYVSETSSRKGRSYLQNPMIDLLMQTAAPNYSPKNPGDPFDILRDKYPLPNGKSIERSRNYACFTTSNCLIDALPTYILQDSSSRKSQPTVRKGAPTLLLGNCCL